MFYPLLSCLVAQQRKEGQEMKLSIKQLNRLREIKGKKNLNINSLAKELGTSRYTISSIINGRTDGISKQTINKIHSYIQNIK